MLILLSCWCRLCAIISMLCCSFFFFKQKTAYEMRISDWSSDVCSSDLQFSCGGDRAASGQHVIHEQDSGALADVVVHLDRGRAVQIGRASCRERVCQYV